MFSIPFFLFVLLSSAPFLVEAQIRCYIGSTPTPPTTVHAYLRFYREKDSALAPLADPRLIVYWYELQRRRTYNITLRRLSTT